MARPSCAAALALVACVGLHLVACYDPALEAQLVDKYIALLEQIPDDERHHEEPAGGWLKKLFGGGGGDRGGDKSTDEKRAQVAQMVDEFNRLDSILSNRLPELEAEPEASARQLAEWLEERDEEGGGGPLAGARQAARYVAELRETLAGGPLACTRGAARLFRLSAHFTGGRPALEAAASRRRVDDVIRHFMLRHEALCRRAYERRYAELLAASRATGDDLVGLLEGRVLARLFAGSPELLAELMLDSGRGRAFAASRDRLAGALAAELALRAPAGELAAGVDAAAHEATFARAYQQLVREPCARFVAATGPDVFEPASFELGLSSARLLESADAEFGLGLGRFHLCRALLAPAANFEALCLRHLRARAN